MHKRKLTVGLSAAMLLLFLLFGFSSSAATGWVNTDGSWRYYDKYGYQVSSEWVKDTNGIYYYMDKNGAMTTNSWIDSSYYVDASGAMLSNQWKKLKPAPGDTFDDYSDEYWYYFSPNGTRVENSWKTINDKKYYFGSQGKMHTGWLDEEFYLGGPDDGSLRSGWIKSLGPYEAEKGVADTDENRNWYYLSKTGNVTVPALSANTKAGTKKINGSTYAFDADGKMLIGWVNLSTDKDSSNIADYKYFGTANDGTLKTGWQYLKAPKFVVQDSWDDGYNWFYLSSAGVPKKSSKNGKYVKSDLASIDGKSYLFDEYGRTKYGLAWVGEELYYFGTKEQCYIQTGYFSNLKEDNGTLSEFFFITGTTDQGKGLTGVNEDYLYYKGKLQKASSKERFRVISMSVGGSNKNYVVNTSGMIQKDATITDGYGTAYRTNSKGILTYIYKDPVKGTDVVGEEPNAPSIDN